ncbi:MAG: FixH family protein [Candidatus Lambdaproteobacteria bacterium]|nr:FixH family protein [Candidatus Lambdaproteobacteria bacterium]
MFLWVVGVFALVLGMNAAMLWISLGARPSLVAPDYYERGVAYDGVIDAVARSRATGWLVTLEDAAGTDSGLALRVNDRAGAPVHGLRGLVEAYRPSDPTLDQTLPLSEDAAAPGRYRATFVHPARGLWRLTVSLFPAGVAPTAPPERGLPAPGVLVYETLRYVAD